MTEGIQMKRMKRTAAFLLAALLVMSMAGCGKDFDAKGYVEAAMAAISSPAA